MAMRRKPELINQDSASWKDCTVLTPMYVILEGKAGKVGQSFSLETPAICLRIGT